MGSCTSILLRNNKNDPEAQKSKSIDKKIKADEKRLRSEVKVLLLGKKIKKKKDSDYTNTFITLT